MARSRNLARRNLACWRPVRESNPCRRREREATYCNSMELSGMDSTLPHLKDSRESLIGLLMEAHFLLQRTYYKMVL